VWELQDHDRLAPKSNFREPYDKSGLAKTFAGDEKGANLSPGNRAANPARITHD
jgi:hypothetical protein